MTDTPPKPVVIEGQAQALNSGGGQKVAAAAHEATCRLVLGLVAAAGQQFENNPIALNASMSGAIAGVMDAWWRLKPPVMSLEEAKGLWHSFTDGYLADMAAARAARPNADRKRPDA